MPCNVTDCSDVGGERWHRWTPHQCIMLSAYLAASIINWTGVHRIVDAVCRCHHITEMHRSCGIIPLPPYQAAWLSHLGTVLSVWQAPLCLLVEQSLLLRQLTPTRSPPMTHSLVCLFFAPCSRVFLCSGKSKVTTSLKYWEHTRVQWPFFRVAVTIPGNVREFDSCQGISHASKKRVPG